MSRGKLLLTLFILLVVCLGLGFAWGASGRLAAQKALDESRQQLDLAEARGQLLDARVSLYNNNFGDATRHFEDAKVPLRRVKTLYQDDGRRDAATGVDAALALIDEAQRLCGKLDPAGNSKAGEALDAIKVAASK
jgi:multidrug efflux pump subunit AcrA (membrane-fusion protein)